MYPNSPGFKTREQALFVYESYYSHSNSIFILPTGWGKSLLFQLPAKQDQDSCYYVVIVPVKELIKDLMDRAKTLKINCATWKENSLGTFPKGLLLCSVQSAISDDFASFLSANKTSIKSIFFDEAHTALTWCSFRDDLKWLPSILARLKIRITLLTATLPPDLEEDMSRRFGVSFKVNRLPTYRSNIQYKISFISGVDPTFKGRPNFFSVFEDSRVYARVASIAKEFRSKLQGCSPDRAIIYIPLKGMREKVEEALDELGVPHVYLDGDCLEAERRQSVLAWRDHGYIMIATSAFGLGIDYPSVRLVITVGFSWSLLDYSQESGRGGRDGKRSMAILVSSQQILQAMNVYRPQLDKEDPQDPEYSFEVADLRTRLLLNVSKYIQSQTKCLKAILSERMDGHPVSCFELPNSSSCDVCEHVLRPLASTSHPIPSHRPTTEVSSSGLLSRLQACNQPPSVAQSSIRSSRAPRTPAPLLVSQARMSVDRYSDSLRDLKALSLDQKIELVDSICILFSRSEICVICLAQGRQDHHPHREKSCEFLNGRCKLCLSDLCRSNPSELISCVNRLSKQQVLDLKSCILCFSGTKHSGEYGKCPETTRYKVQYFCYALLVSDPSLLERICRDIPTDRFNGRQDEVKKFELWLRSPKGRQSCISNGMWVFLSGVRARLMQNP